MSSPVTTLSHRSHLARTARYAEWAPEPLRAFGEFAAATFADGVLSKLEKELVAVGCAHVLRCGYCIDYHVDLARKAGADDTAISEAAWVGVAMAASACHAHAGVAMDLLNGAEGDYYRADADAAALARQLAAANPAADAAHAALQEAALADGTVSARCKRLIAVGCVHNIRCPRCIEREVRAALDAGEERKAISEAVWVAVEMAAGATFGHAGLTAALLDDG